MLMACRKPSRVGANCGGSAGGAGRPRRDKQHDHTGPQQRAGWPDQALAAVGLRRARLPAPTLAAGGKQGGAPCPSLFPTGFCSFFSGARPSLGACDLVCSFIE